MTQLRSRSHYHFFSLLDRLEKRRWAYSTKTMGVRCVASQRKGHAHAAWLFAIALKVRIPAFIPSRSFIPSSVPLVGSMPKGGLEGSPIYLQIAYGRDVA